MLSDPYVRPETDHFVTDTSGCHSKVVLRVRDYKVYRRYALAVPQKFLRSPSYTVQDQHVSSVVNTIAGSTRLSVQEKRCRDQSGC